MEKERGRVTIKSIADELGISFSTVARALDNNPIVRQETRELVQRKAKEMNYTRNGVQDAYSEKGLVLRDESVFWFKPEEQSAAKQFTQCWTDRHGELDGVICFCDSMAFGVYRAARQLQLQIPEDVGVIGYDDSSFNDFSAPPLTSIHMPKDLVAQYCSRFVLDRLLHGDTQKHAFALEPYLVERSSVAFRKQP